VGLADLWTNKMLVVYFIVVTNILLFGEREGSAIALKDFNLVHKQTCPQGVLANNDIRTEIFVQRLQQGLPVAVMLVGGSSSLGRTLHGYQSTFIGKFDAWVKTHSPNSGHKIINSARGATGSSYMSKCLQLHCTGFDADFKLVTLDRVDLVLVEYAVNDFHTTLHNAATASDVQRDTEILVDRVLDLPGQPAVIMLQLFSKRSLDLFEQEQQPQAILYSERVSEGEGPVRVSDVQNRVAASHGVPVVQLNAVLNSSVARQALAEDNVHMNEMGHSLAAEHLIQYLMYVNSTTSMRGKRGDRSRSSRGSRNNVGVNKGSSGNGGSCWQCMSAMPHKGTRNLDPQEAIGWVFDEAWSAKDSFKVPVY
jgi:hypothetical protein